MDGFTGGGGIPNGRIHVGGGYPEWTWITPPNHTSLWKQAVCGLLTIQERGAIPRVQPDAARPLRGWERLFSECSGSGAGGITDFEGKRINTPGAVV